MTRLQRLCAAVFGTVLLAFHATTPAAADKPPVQETFKVGESVYVRALHIDPTGKHLWVGTSAGVHEIDLATKSAVNTFTRKDGLANEYVFAVGTDTAGYTWFGTNAGGASRYKDGQWKTYFPMHGLADYWIYAFANDTQDNLWIGTWAGVNHFDVKTGKLTTYVKELINEWVYGIDVDASGRVWFGTEGGVTMYDGQRWTSWTHADGLGGENVAQLPASENTGLGTRSRHDLSTLQSGQATYNPNYVFAMHVDEQQRIWAGTWGGGAARFDGSTWTNFTSRDGLVGDIVYAIARDPDNALWFGTNRGVSRFDGSTWTNYTHHDGLLDSHVYAIATAANGDVWVGTRGGVARIGRSK